MSTSSKEALQPQKISPQEIRINLQMIVQDEDTISALEAVRNYGFLMEEGVELTPEKALEICRGRLKAIKKAERTYIKPPFG